MHGGYALTPIARPDGLGLLRSPGGIRDKRKRASADAAELGSSPGPPGAEMRSSNPMHLIGVHPRSTKSESGRGAQNRRIRVIGSVSRRNGFRERLGVSSKKPLHLSGQQRLRLSIS